MLAAWSRISGRGAMPFGTRIALSGRHGRRPRKVAGVTKGLGDDTAMDPAHACAIRCLVLAAQALGLGSAWLARRSEGSAWQSRFQQLFVVSLFLMGAATILAMGLGPCGWLASGTTFSLMVLGATCDFHRETEAEAEFEG